MAYYSLSDLKRFIDSEKDDSFWIGLDVHKKSYYVALLGTDDKTFTWSTPADPQKLLDQLKSLHIKLSGACYEAGPTGYSLARTLQEAKIPVIVAAPNKIPRNVSHGSKTDRLDCLKLVQYAAKGLIKPIAIPSTIEESERALLRRRHQIIDHIRKNKQRIKGLFLFAGIPEPIALKHWRSDSAEAIRHSPFLFAEAQTLESHIQELNFLSREQKRIELQLKMISRMENHKQVMESLMTVPGVGFITAITFHLEIFNPERFKTKEQIASYLGLAPTVHHSGESHPRGHLTPVGQQRLRAVLIEASWFWISKDEYAAGLFRKYVSKSDVKQKAIAAVARKLAIILWRLSIEKRAYR